MSNPRKLFLSAKKGSLSALKELETIANTQPSNSKIYLYLSECFERGCALGTDKEKAKSYLDESFKNQPQNLLNPMTSKTLNLLKIIAKDPQFKPINNILQNQRIPERQQQQLMDLAAHTKEVSFFNRQEKKLKELCAILRNGDENKLNYFAQPYLVKYTPKKLAMQPSKP